MKILAASDLHGDTRHIEKLAEKAFNEKVDMVLLCGDLVLDESLTDGIVGPFKKRNIPVSLLPGNHESSATTRFLAQTYGAKHLHGYSFRLGDVAFFGAGHANVGPHATSEEDTYSLLKKGHDYVLDAKKKIMVTHVHPEESISEKISSFKGSTAVRKAIDTFKPDIHLCGHIHECEGIEEKIGSTLSINVGKNGKIIDV